MQSKRPAAVTLGLELESFANDITDTYFALKQFGEAVGLTHDHGSNISTILSMLFDRGQMTVAEAARIRGVSRQYAIKLAQQLEAEGVIELLRDVPGGRSYHMRLTPTGREQVRARSALFRRVLAERSVDLDLAKIETARGALADFRRRLLE